MSMGRSLLFTVVFMFTILLAHPVLAGVPSGGYDRMEGERMRANRRPVPERSFSQTLPPGERLNVYSVKRTAPPRSGSRAGRRTDTAPFERNPQTEPYEPQVNRLYPDGPRPEGEGSDRDSGESGEGVSAESRDSGEERARLQDAGDAAGTPESQEVRGGSEIAGSTIVYCSRQLYEYHLDQDCPMLTGINPTRMTLQSAKTARYVECSACRNRHQK